MQAARQPFGSEAGVAAIGRTGSFDQALRICRLRRLSKDEGWRGMRGWLEGEMLACPRSRLWDG